MNCCRLRTLPSEAHTSRPTGLISEARGILLHFLQLPLFLNYRPTKSISERHVLQGEREQSACDARGRARNGDLRSPISHLPVVFRSGHRPSSTVTAQSAIYRTLNLPQTRRQVLGTDLNCSESRCVGSGVTRRKAARPSARWEAALEHLRRSERSREDNRSGVPGRGRVQLHAIKNPPFRQPAFLSSVSQGSVKPRCRRRQLGRRHCPRSFSRSSRTSSGRSFRIVERRF